MLRAALRLLAPSVARFTYRMISVTAVPALGDNYMYLLVDTNTKSAAVVDPVEPKKALLAAQEQGVQLEAILTTHHHWDHAGGNGELAATVKGIKVYGGDSRIDALNNKVTQGDTFKLGELTIQCLFTPCHTSGHICYYVTDAQGNKVVFTGDTLFIGGCGKFFEGTPDQMYEALVTKLGALPDDTKVYCGHEYTINNLKFAKAADPENPAVDAKITWAKDVINKRQYTVPSSIGEEKQFNPFMRVHDAKIQQLMGSTDPVQVMKLLREKKNRKS